MNSNTHGTDSNQNLMVVIKYLAFKCANENYQASKKRRSRCPHRGQFDAGAYAKTEAQSFNDAQATTIDVNAAFTAQKIVEVLEPIHSTALRTFTSSVLAEPEVKEALMDAVVRNGVATGLRIDALQTMALGMRDWCVHGAAGRDVVYVATLLHGIQQFLAAGLTSGADLGDVMFTIVRSALHRLDDQSVGEAGLLRLCMGWANADEESETAQELQQLMVRATKTLELARF